MTSRSSALLSCAAFISALALAPAPALAQVQTQFGVQGGINVANIDFTTDDPEFTADFKSRTRGVGGIVVAWDFNPNAGLQLDFLYSQKGTKAGATITEDGETFDFNLEASVDYLEIPILVRANMPASDTVKFRVFGGPAIGFKVSDDFKQSINGVDIPAEEGDAPEFKSYDFSLVAGGAVQFGQFFVDARYSWGLVNISNDDEGEKVKTRTFGFMVGFMFN